MSTMLRYKICRAITMKLLLMKKILVLSLFSLIVTVACEFSSRSVEEVAPPSSEEKPAVEVNNQKNIESLKNLKAGVFFPAPKNQIIKNVRPTIIGKLNQNAESLFLENSFQKEESVISGEKYYFLKFNIGKIKNARFFLDGQEFRDIFAIPQFPDVICGEAPYNEQQGYYEEWVDYETQEECFSKSLNKIPPAVFFYRPPSDLSVGKHVLKVIPNNQEPIEMIFTIDPLKPDVPVHIDFEHEYHDDNCHRGYYYSESFLHIPIPEASPDNVFWSLYFPRSKSEMSQPRGGNQVYISFEKNRYELFFPSAGSFFAIEPPEQNPLSNYQPSNSLFLPLERLVYADGQNAMPLDITSKDYFRLVPFDQLGRIIKEGIFEQKTTSTSWCDG